MLDPDLHLNVRRIGREEKGLLPDRFSTRIFRSCSAQLNTSTNEENVGAHFGVGGVVFEELSAADVDFENHYLL